MQNLYTIFTYALTAGTGFVFGGTFVLMVWDKAIKEALKEKGINLGLPAQEEYLAIKMIREGK
jgi:hypothetical protein